MRQDGLRPAAPTDPDPRWPAGYMAVLREAGAQENNIPYCIDWVRAIFARHPGRRRRDLGRAGSDIPSAPIAANHDGAVRKAHPTPEPFLVHTPPHQESHRQDQPPRPPLRMRPQRQPPT